MQKNPFLTWNKILFLNHSLLIAYEGFLPSLADHFMNWSQP
jgi:hypothetical protein